MDTHFSQRLREVGHPRFGAPHFLSDYELRRLKPWLFKAPSVKASSFRRRHLFPLPTDAFRRALYSGAASRLDSRGRLSPHESQSYFILTFRRARLKPCAFKAPRRFVLLECFATRD